MPPGDEINSIHFRRRTPCHFPFGSWNQRIFRRKCLRQLLSLYQRGILNRTSAHLIFDGATLNGREMATVASPKPGNWMILVDGFNIWGKLANDGTESGPQKDSYRVRVVQQ